MANPKKGDSQLADATGKALIGLQQTTIADAVVAHSLTDADASLGATSQAEIEAVLDALGVVINLCIATLDAHGLTADS